MLSLTCLITSALGQYVSTVFTNDDCTGDRSLVVNRLDKCPNPATTDTCVMGEITKCLQNPPLEVFQPPNPELKYLVGNFYTGSTCQTGFTQQEFSVADGGCRKFRSRYLKKTCDSGQAITAICTDIECTQCTMYNYTVGSCVNVTADDGRQLFEKMTCLGPTSKSNAVTKGFAVVSIVSLIISYL